MFQTIVDIPRSSLTISYQSNIMALGSCFAENIGSKLTNERFETEINPFGVLFNPISIKNSIDILLKNKQFTEDDIFENNSLWQSFAHSSLFSDITPESCLERINSRLDLASNHLRKTYVLLITFGTAWVFEYKNTQKVVSNCHKLPASEFVRRRLSVEEIVENYTELIQNLKSVLPDLQLVFTISPVRHWKDGAHDNNLSKSTLQLAIDSLQQKFSHIHYFPAYEIQMDELRDYRFYAPDMVHPSEVAVNYIWERFSTTYFDATTLLIKSEIEQFQRDASHRPLHPESIEFQKFSKSLKQKKELLIQKYPFLRSKL